MSGTDGELESRLRATLRRQAATVPAGDDPFEQVQRRAARLRRRHRLLGGAAVLLLASGAAAGVPLVLDRRDQAALVPAGPPPATPATAAGPGTTGAAPATPASSSPVARPAPTGPAAGRGAAGWAFRGDAAVSTAQRAGLSGDPAAAGAAITPLYAAADPTGGHALYLVRPAGATAHFTLVQDGRVAGTEPVGPPDAPFFGLVRGEAYGTYLVVADPAASAASLTDACGTHRLAAPAATPGVYLPTSLSCPRPPAADTVTVTVPDGAGQLTLGRAYRDYAARPAPGEQTG